jgi:hypothetical protein
VILPTKGIAPDSALISVGARVLALLAEPKTVSRVWDEFRRNDVLVPGVTFDWFVLSLDLLFAIGAVELNRGRLYKTNVGGEVAYDS